MTTGRTCVCQKCGGSYFTWRTYTNETLCEDCALSSRALSRETHDNTSAVVVPDSAT